MIKDADQAKPQGGRFGLPVRPPVHRRLRGYAFDPSLSIQLETALVNETVFKVPWEKLEIGPVGEYLEVVDFDPASECFYAPVNLDDPLVLAQDGLAPSDGQPQFHQQMVYAVAMMTIANFEHALGRRALWAPHWEPDAPEGEKEQFVQRLRIYPHALREANAYYSPQKKALLFGYFPASDSLDSGHLPGGMVFTCLSHDIVAHETTHALLDGMHRRFIEASHPDSLAFHEAFADIVALFQHFTFPEVLRHQIAHTRGDLASQNMLGELAQQFGKALGHHGALRDAIGTIDPLTKKWKPLEPDPNLYHTVLEPHDRGAILVAAVFDAFLSIYKCRVADLLRIATSGTGVLPAGALHPDLVNRLAEEAATSAQHVLNMCIRALDYCPPVDITFGDYLRAIVTADHDLVPDDKLGYRIAMIEAFRRRGIFPQDVRTLSEKSLLWPSRSEFAHLIDEDLEFAGQELRDLLGEIRYLPTRLDVFNETRRMRERLHGIVEKMISDGGNVGGDYQRAYQLITGLVLDPDRKVSGIAVKDGRMVFEVHSLRAAQRVGPNGNALNQVIVTLTQKRQVTSKDETPFNVRGGCTLIIDLDTLELQHAITKPIDDDRRANRQAEFRAAMQGQSLRATYFADDETPEPFAILHRGM